MYSSFNLVPLECQLNLVPLALVVIFVPRLWYGEYIISPITEFVV